jgi:hypothetical protein
MRIVNGVSISTIESVKIAHVKTCTDTAGWFSADNMRFWKCRVGNAVYGSRYFVTSDETFDGRRAYSIRELTDKGYINTVAFQAYNSRYTAHKAAKTIAGME